MSAFNKAALCCAAALAVATVLPAQAQDGAAAPNASSDVRACQVGYLPGEKKFAMLAADAEGDVIVRRADDDAEVLRVTPGDAAEDADSGDTLRPVDFSDLREPGTYYLDAPGLGKSHPFTIGDDVFARPFRLALRSFYGQRCGTAVSMAPDFPEYEYPACHTMVSQFHPSSGREGERNTVGGWHDAGDYNRYIVNSGITTGTLLWAYELNADKLRDLNLDLPESGNGTPDILNEARWNLEWMLTMQDETDGGVWHKNTSANFSGFVMPQEDNDPMLIVGAPSEPHKVTAATADFAAVMAAAARVYREFDADFADQCLAAAKAAFEWAVEHPESHYGRQPEGINTGGYGDGNARDEILWAAAELFRTTGDDRYNAYFLDHYEDFELTATEAPAWPVVYQLAFYSYALADGADAEVAATMKQQAIAAADGIVERASANGYRNPMPGDQYVWGSNGNVANYGLMLRMADHFDPNRAYVDAAQDALHYLLGRNTFGKSFVTHVGSDWFMHPHHRPSGADGIEQPWPGLLSGGPNAGRDTPPARQWVDDQDSYSKNENAINWNAPLVFLLAEALPEAGE